MLLGAPFTAISPILKVFGTLGGVGGLIVGYAFSSFGVAYGCTAGALFALVFGVLIPRDALRQQKRGVERLARGAPPEPWWYTKRTRVAELPLPADKAFELCARKILRRHPGGKLLEQYRGERVFGDASTTIELVPLSATRTQVRVEVHLPRFQLFDDGSLFERAEEVAEILEAQKTSASPS